MNFRLGGHAHFLQTDLLDSFSREKNDQLICSPNFGLGMLFPIISRNCFNGEMKRKAIRHRQNEQRTNGTAKKVRA